MGPIRRVSADPGMPVVRIGAEIDLSRDMYDPEGDTVTERGRQLLSEYLCTSGPARRHRRFAVRSMA